MASNCKIECAEMCSSWDQIGWKCRQRGCSSDPTGRTPDPAHRGLFETLTLSKQGHLQLRSPGRMSCPGACKSAEWQPEKDRRLAGGLSFHHTARAALTDSGSCKSHGIQPVGRQPFRHTLLTPTLPGWSGPMGGEFLTWSSINGARPGLRLTIFSVFKMISS
jgi:hypothetical protein